MSKIFGMLFFLMVAMCANSQEPSQKKPPSPEEMKKIMEAAMAPMIPIMAKMTDAMLEQMLQKGDEPATATRLAHFKKNLYDALIKEGFSADQAFAILLDTNLPTVAPQLK